MPKKAEASATQPRPSTPMPTKVQEDAEHRPVAVRVMGQEVSVAGIDERWEGKDSGGGTTLWSR